MARKPWEVSFDSSERLRDRERTARRAPDPPEAQSGDAGQQRCARGAWCAGRTIVIERGIRTVTAAATSRPFCDKCAGHITACLEEMPRLYRDLHHELAEQHSAGNDVPVVTPFGPSIPLDLAIDAHMRAMTETLCSWEIRVRDLASLSDIPAEDKPQDDLADLERAVDILAPERISILLGLGEQEMVRFVPAGCDREEYQSAEIMVADRWTMKVTAKLGGLHAGQEVMHLHYMARRLLLETSPPMPLLPDFRCRCCEQKLLRAASAPWHEDGIWYWSRCDGCGDEMTRSDYDVNARRWIAYEKAMRATPTLAGLAVPA